MMGYVIYFIVYAISMFLLYMYLKFSNVDKIESKWQRRIRKFAWIVLIISPLVLLAAFRYETGTDYGIYSKFYDLNVQNGPNYFIRTDGTIPEMLFWGLLEIAKSTFGDVHMFFFLASFITMFLVVLTLDRYKGKINILLSYAIFLLLLYPVSYNIVRQMIAVAVVMYGFKYIVNRNIIKYCIAIIIASLFHASAIFCLLFLAFADIKNEKMNEKKNYTLFLVLALIPLLMPVLMSIGEQIPVFAKYYNAYEIFFQPRWGLVIKKLPLLILSIMYVKKIIAKDKKDIVYFQMFFADIVACFISFYVRWGYRMVYYLDFSQLILFPLIVKAENNKQKRIMISIFLVLYYVIYFVYSFVIQNQEGIFPYQTILMGEL